MRIVLTNSEISIKSSGNQNLRDLKNESTYIEIFFYQSLVINLHLNDRHTYIENIT